MTDQEDRPLTKEEFLSIGLNDFQAGKMVRLSAKDQFVVVSLIQEGHSFQQAWVGMISSR